MANRQLLLADRVYVELVRSLFVNVTPAAIMAVAFTLSVVLIAQETGNSLSTALGVAGVIAISARLAVTIKLRKRALSSSFDAVEARRLELLFLKYMNIKR